MRINSGTPLIKNDISDAALNSEKRGFFYFILRIAAVMLNLHGIHRILPLSKKNNFN